MKCIKFLLIFACFNVFSNKTPDSGEEMSYDRILKISRIGNPILRQEAEDVNDILSQEIKNIIQDMKTTFKDFGLTAVGLAAPQINCSLKIMILQIPIIEQKELEGFPLTVMINPQYKPLKEEKSNEYEGCLSIPGFMGLVPRYTDIAYSYQDEEGNLIQGEAHGYLARVFQHEYDHLLGKLYIDRIEDFSTFGLVEEIRKNISE